MLDAVQTLAVAGLVAWLGEAVCRRVDWLARLSIPGRVVGGLAAAMAMLALRSTGLPAAFGVLVGVATLSGGPRTVPQRRLPPPMYRAIAGCWARWFCCSSWSSRASG